MTLSDSDDTDTPMDKSYLKNKLKSFVSTSSDMKKEMENDRKGFESKLNIYRLELEKLQQTNEVLQKELEKYLGLDLNRDSTVSKLNQSKSNVHLKEIRVRGECQKIMHLNY